MNQNDESVTLDMWTGRFWDEYEAWNQDSSKAAPRLWGSLMASASKYMYVILSGPAELRLIL
jgi:hypothetical protein